MRPVWCPGSLSYMPPYNPPKETRKNITPLNRPPCAAGSCWWRFCFVCPARAEGIQGEWKEGKSVKKVQERAVWKYLKKLNQIDREITRMQLGEMGINYLLNTNLVFTMVLGFSV